MACLDQNDLKFSHGLHFIDCANYHVRIKKNYYEAFVRSKTANEISVRKYKFYFNDVECKVLVGF